MKEIKVDNFEDLKEAVEDLKYDESISMVDENGEPKFVVFSYETIKRVSDFMEQASNTNVKVVSTDGSIPELSFEEYEAIKSSVIKTLEENLKPKADKLN